MGERLRDSSLITRLESIELPARGKYEIGGVGGLWIFTASYYTSSSLICNMGQITGIHEIDNIGIVFSITDIEGKVCVLNKGGSVVIKNNTDTDYSQIRIAIIY